MAVGRVSLKRLYDLSSVLFCTCSAVRVLVLYCVVRFTPEDSQLDARASLLGVSTQGLGHSSIWTLNPTGQSE